MFRRKCWYILLVSLLLISLSGNLVLVHLARQQYRSMQSVRLDPTSEKRFAKLNAELSLPEAGEKRVVFAGASRIDMWHRLPVVQGCQMVNRGQSNDTSAQLLLRLRRDVLDLKPDVVYLEIGNNDLKSIGALPDQEQKIADRLRANRAEIIKQLTDAKIHVIVSTIYPFGDISLKRRLFWSDRSLMVRDTINDEIRKLNQPNITFFDADSIFAENGRMKAQYQLDDFHLNNAGYEALNQAVEPLIRSLTQIKK